MPLSVFPVASEGAPHYSDDFGYVKPGASKGHQGIDIFAGQGAPVLAPDAGALRLTTDPIGGQVFFVTAGDGTVYYGAHLSAYEGSDRTVAAGDVVGYVGTTGNAKGTSPHLHFEVHPSGGAAVDPFPMLAALQPQAAGSSQPTNPFDAASADLAGLQSKLDAANQLLASDLQTSPISITGSWLADAIEAFQGVGGTGVATVAPDIDGAGFASVTQPLTQSAWLLNKQLAAIPTSGQYNTQAQANATLARDLAQQIVQTYGEAIVKGQAAASTPRPPGPQPTPAPAPSGRPDLSRFVTITPGLAGKAIAAAYLQDHPTASGAPLDKLAFALAWALGPEGSFTRAFQGSNNWGAYQATKNWIDAHHDEPGYGLLAFMDHAPAPYIATMRIYPSPQAGARGFLQLVERDVGDWSTIVDAHDFATRLYVAGYYGGLHAERTPVADRKAALAAGTLTADDQANINDGAGGLARALVAAQYAIAQGLSEAGDPSAPTTSRTFAPLADRLTLGKPPHTIDHARQLLASSSAAGDGISLADALAAPGGDGVWLFGPGQSTSVVVASSSSTRSSSGVVTALAIAATLAIVVAGASMMGGRMPLGEF